MAARRATNTFKDYRALLGLSDLDLATVDPLEMNLLVARSIPGLAELEIAPYQEQADAWAEEVRQRLPAAEEVFWQTPWQWKNDVRFFRLGVLCGFVDVELGIAYHEEQRDGHAVLYTEPGDLFLHGVMDSRRGTCANMPALHVALAWRLGWPVSLACVRSHYICRYDDGQVQHNIEATQAGLGGFKSDPDDYLVARFGLTAAALSSGSDLRAVTARELLGIFVGFRARHMRDTGKLAEAERDYLLARHLFPANRVLYQAAMGVQVMRSEQLFAPHEAGAPRGLLGWLQQQYPLASGVGLGSMVITTAGPAWGRLGH